MVATTKAFSANQFLFVLDGKVEAGFIRAVSGGSVKGEIVEEGLGSDLLKAKHIGVLQVEPIKLELGMAMSKPMLGWIKRSWEKDFARHSGAIIHADFDYREQMVQEFFDSLVTETKFPELDARSKEPAYLSVSIQPESIKFKKGGGQKIQSTSSRNQKRWTASSFELDIDGIDCAGVSKIDSFTVKQKVKQIHYGTGRFPEIEPTGLEFGNLTFYVSLAHADDWLEWFDDYVLQGAREEEAEKDGHLTFLDQSGSETLFSIQLQRIGIHTFQIDASKANSDDIKRVKVECYVESMKLEFGSGLD
jgi:hypothetical protein